MPNQTKTVFDENKRELGINLTINDTQNEGKFVRLELVEFLRKFETQKQRDMVRTAIHSALRTAPEFPTLRQLHDEGKTDGPYAIDDGYTSNGGDGCMYEWRGRKFQVVIYNGNGEHAAGETEVSEIKEED